MKIFLPKSAIFTFAFLIANLFFANVCFGQATVMTDKADYQPGDAVIVTGTGWQPGETVSLHFIETPQVCTSNHDRLTVADSNGNIYYNQFLINIKHLGVSFVLTAIGQSSNLSAEVLFTDAGYQFDAVGLPSSTSVVVNYTISGTGSGNGTFNTTSFIPPATAGNNNNNKTITVNSYTPTYSPAPSIKYSILNYSLRVGPSGSPITQQTSNVFAVGGNSPSEAVLFTANYGALVAASNVVGIYGSSVLLTSTFYSNYQTSAPISGKTITFYINGTSVGTGTTNASGVATLNLDLTNVPSLGKLNSGTYTITSSFAGDVSYLAISSANSTSGLLTVNKKSITITAANQTVVYGTSVATVTGAGTYTAAGFVAPDTSAVIGGTAAYTTNYTATTPAATPGINIVPGVSGLIAANYSFTPVNGTVTVGKANSTITATGANLFTYNGLPQGPGTSTVTGSTGAVSYKYSGVLPTVYSQSATRPVNAGTYQVIATVAADSNYNGKDSDPFGFTIGKASSTTVVTINGGPFTYTGAAIEPATVSVTGAGGLNLAPTASYGSNTDAGTASASYTFAGDANHDGSSDSKDFTIGKASSTTVVTINGGPFAYTGAAIEPATVSVTGAGGLNLAPTASYNSNTDAGTASAGYTFAGDANHDGSSDSKDFTIGKASSTTVVTINGGPFTYTGAAIEPATVSVTGAGGLNLAPTASYNSNTDAGTASAGYTFAGDANHDGSSDSKDFTIGKASSTTVVTINGGPFTYTGAAIEPATVSVTGAGGLNLAPTASYNSNTNAGTASAGYTFAGDANHDGSSDSKTFEIGKASSTTVVTINGGPFTYTGAAIEPATVSVTGAGGLNLAPTASYGSNTDAGTASASYTFAGDANHDGSSDSKDFTIGKASSTTVVTINGGPFTYTGAAIEPATVSVTGAGSLNMSPTASYGNNTNAGTASAGYTFAGDANHDGSSDSKDFTIGKASSTTVVTISGGPFTYTGAAIEPATVSVTGAGGLNMSPTASYNSNTNAGTASAGYTFAGDANHDGSSDSKNFTIGKASSTTVVTINGGPFTYTGAAIEPATVSVTGAGGLNLAPTASYGNNTNAGTASASYAFAGDANHDGSSDSKNFTIGKASSTTVVTINGGPFTYTGAAIEPATVSVTGAGGLNLAPTASYGNNTDAGTASAGYTFAGDANHDGSSDSKDFTIGKASSTTVVTINGGPFTYTGAAIEPATVSVTGAGSLNMSPTASYGNNTNAGTASASYTFAGDANHDGSSDSKDFTIGKASSTTVVTINGGPFTYTGAAIEPATVSVTGAGGLNLTPIASYGNNTNAGTVSAGYTFAGDANHEASSDSKTFEIGKASSTTVVTINGGPFAYTGSAIEPATVSVTGAGGLNMSPAASYGNNTNAGTASASYTFAGDANHDGSSDSKDFTIGKASSTTVVTINGDPFTYTGAAIEPATVSVTGAGSLNMSPTASYGNNINAGTASASYAYAGDANHDGSSDSKDFTIGKASSTTVVTISGGPFTYTGAAIEPATVSVTGAGGLNMSPTASYNSNTNAGTASAGYTFAGDANHDGSSDSKDFTIGKASSTTVVTINGGPFTYTGAAIEPATVSVTGAGGLNLAPTASYGSNTDAGTASASYAFAGDANHGGSSDSKDFTIGKASSTTVVTINGGPFTYTGAAIEPATVSVTGAGGLNLAPTASYGNNTNAGTASAGYTFAGDANHDGSSDSKDFTIGKASSTTVVTINGGPFTYTGAAIEPATVSVTGAGGLNLAPTASYGNNTNAGTASAGYTFAGDANHDGSSDSKDFTIGKASSTTVVTINGGPFTYTGAAIEPATVSVTGAGGLNLAPTASYGNNTNAGTASAGYTFAGDANHDGSSDSKDFTIGKASSTTVVTINGGPFTYTGAAIEPATVSVTGAGGLNMSPTASYNSNTNAGTASAGYTFAGDANHDGSSDSKDFTIGKASSTTVVTINGGPFTYTGAAIEPATVSVTGAGSLNMSPTASYGNNINAGTASAGYAYAGDANHDGSSDSKTFEIGKASSTTVVTINGGPFTYTGAAIEPATVSVTGAGGLNLAPTASYGNNTNAGTASASYAYTGDANHDGSSDSKDFTIGKASSTTVVTINGGPFTYTGAAIEPATVSVTGAGSLNMSPTASYGNNINAGTASASYAYAGDANHDGSSDSKTFEIGKASSTTAVTINGGPFTYTGAAIEPATVSVTGAGGLNLAPTASYGNNTDAGTASAGYTFAGDANHDGSSDSKDFTIGKASSTTVVTINGGPFTYTGAAIEPATVSVTGAGGLNLAPTASYNSNTNAGTASAGYTFAGDANHDGSSDSKTFEIGKASSTTVVTINGGPFTYTGAAIEPATVSVTGAGGLNLAPTASYGSNTDAGTASAGYTFAGDANHDGSSDSKDFTIGKASSTTVVTINGGPFTYTGAAIEPATVSVTGAGGLNLAPTASYGSNTDAGTASASYAFAGDANHGGSSDSKDFTIGKASSTTVVTINGGPFTYTGAAIEPATVSVTGAGGLNLAPTASYGNNTNAGTASAGYTFAGDANHDGSSDSKDFTIGKASSTTVVTINGGPFTYTGAAIEPATVSVTGAGGLNLAPTASYGNNTNAGTASAGYTFAGDANHDGSSDSKDFTIGKASSTTVVTINGGPFTYTGAAIEPATVSVTGAGGLNLAPTASYGNNTNAGTASAGYTFAGDANHDGSSDSKDFTIGKASSTTVVTINGGPFTYTGAAIEPATVSVTGAGGLNMSPTASYNSNTNAGTASASYTFAGDANHDGSSDSKDFTIGKASSTTVVTINGGPFTYTGAAIEPATVSVTGAGSLNMSPTASYGNNINAGTASASYAYAGDANHDGSSDSKDFTIGKASSTTVVTISGGPFTYTGAAIEPATVSVTGAGGLNMSPTASYNSNTNAGTASAGYTFAGDANHDGSSDSKDFTIGKASSTTVVTINGGPFTYTGAAIEPATVSVTGAGSLNMSPTASYGNNINAGTASAGYAYAGDANHDGSSDSKTFEIGKASSTTVVTINGGPFTYTGAAIEPATVSVTGAGGLNLAPTASYGNNTNAGTASASYAYTGDANHDGSSDSKDFTIGKASSTTVVTINGGPFTYTGAAIEPATVSVTGAGSLNMSPTASYGNNINAGTASASYAYAGDANHDGSSDSKTFEIGKASSTTAVTINGGPFTYTGAAIEPATVSVTGAGGLNLAPTASYGNNTDAGTASAGYTFAGDANHDGSSDSKDFTIGKASSTTVVTINGGPFTYTGAAIEPATVSVTGAGGLNLAPTASYGNNTNAGTASAGYTFAGDANHDGSSDSKDFTIGKASSTTVVTINGGPFTYTGAAIEPATVSVTGAGGLNLAPTASYGNNTNAGTASAGYTFAGDANHDGSSDSKDFTIGKASSTTVVTINGGPFTYTGAAIEPATVSVTGAGGLNMSPTASYNSNTNAGTASAGYTFAGDANHDGSSDSKDFTIGKASSTTVVTINGGPFTYTGAAIEPATVSVTGAGSLNMSPTASYGNNINAGTASASYAYAGDANHDGSSDSKDFTIGKASSTTAVTINGGPFTFTGSAIEPATVSVTGAGGLNMSPTASYNSNTNAGTASASYTFSGDANHEGSSDSKTFEIGKANPTIVVTPYSVTYDTVAHTATGTAKGVQGAALAGLNLGETIHTNAGTYTSDAWVFTDVTGNYNNANGTVNNTISKANTSVSATGGMFNFDDNAHAVTAHAIGIGGINITTPFTFSYVGTNCAGTYNSGSAPSAPGTYTAMAAFGGNSNYNGSSATANISITSIMTASATGTNNVCNAGNTGTATVIPTLGKSPYSYLWSNGALTQTITGLVAGAYNVTVTDANNCTKTASYTVTQPLALSATITTNNPNLYFGYSGDQAATITVKPIGGKAPYRVEIMMVDPLPASPSRPIERVGGKLICDYINTTGDETWTSVGTTYQTINSCMVQPKSISSNPASTSFNNIPLNGSYSVNVTLLADARFIATVVDANGCSYTIPYNQSVGVDAEDARCFAGNSGVVKVAICHQTGSAKNPCTAICVDQSAVQEHLNHGDFLGKCTNDCKPQGSNAKNIHSEKMLIEATATDIEPAEFAVKVFPNPSDSQFTLVTEGGNNEKVEVLVYDMFARRVKRIEKNDNQPIVFGEEFSSGEYIVLIRQGENAKTLNLIKK
ncbi:hypothetical protein CLU83_0885 [Flavobacterium sp. 1]|uniref:T9SS type A sorting domain-containing protein n=1 Tax=Flavobacterium sp. 1 TaxID=2035200 RepID=UPI000C24F796|nr:T9SS type A sorting domain-containing protein [Flavobacterium sp. 1]PJJ07689.1 hypothetical protein CLU83_0885 [Flavobacterium sp. 1]